MLLEDFTVGRGLAVCAACGHRVPLVHNNDDAAAALVRVAADGCVAGRYAFRGIDDNQSYVSSLKMAPGHDDRHLFGHQVGLALAADAGRVDKAQHAAFELNDFIHRIARGAGNRRDNGA